MEATQLISRGVGEESVWKILNGKVSRIKISSSRKTTKSREGLVNVSVPRFGIGWFLLLGSWFEAVRTFWDLIIELCENRDYHIYWYLPVLCSVFPSLFSNRGILRFWKKEKLILVRNAAKQLSHTLVSKVLEINRLTLSIVPLGKLYIRNLLYMFFLWRETNEQSSRKWFNGIATC